MKIETKQLRDMVNECGFSLYDPMWGCSRTELEKAQKNLVGRTHYVDPDTLRWFGARILNTTVIADGLIYGLLESVAHPSRGRLYRPVFFDIAGNTITRCELDDCPKTKRAAEKLFYKMATDLTEQAPAITLHRLNRERKKLESRIGAMVELAQAMELEIAK